jgi:hypothetical protein
LGLQAAERFADDLARRVEAVVQGMDASGELVRLREALLKQVLNQP